MLNKLSTIIISFNEEDNIGRCLESVAGVSDEIVVVDSYSTDRTREICAQYNVRFHQHPFEGYTRQKQYALSLAENRIILNIDADECLSPELHTSIEQAKNNWTSDGYSMNRLNSFCGQWIRHGAWHPDRKLRLFDRTKMTWGGRPPHDWVEMNPGTKVGKLQGDLLHYTVGTLAEFQAQVEKFSIIRAKLLFAEGKKPNFFYLYVKPGLKFFIHFVLRMGFLDGPAGFHIAWKSALGYRRRYVILKQLYAGQFAG